MVDLLRSRRAAMFFFCVMSDLQRFAHAQWLVRMLIGPQGLVAALARMEMFLPVGSPSLFDRDGPQQLI